MNYAIVGDLNAKTAVLPDVWIPDEIKKNSIFMYRFYFDYQVLLDNYVPVDRHKCKPNNYDRRLFWVMKFQ